MRDGGASWQPAAGWHPASADCQSARNMPILPDNALRASCRRFVAPKKRVEMSLDGPETGLCATYARTQFAP
jgi:hypothetical protein